MGARSNVIRFGALFFGALGGLSVVLGDLPTAQSAPPARPPEEPELDESDVPVGSCEDPQPCEMTLDGGVQAVVPCTVTRSVVRSTSDAGINYAQIELQSPADAGEPKASVRVTIPDKPIMPTFWSADVVSKGIEWWATWPRTGSARVKLTATNCRSGLLHGGVLVRLPVSNIALGYQPLPVILRARF